MSNNTSEGTEVSTPPPPEIEPEEPAPVDGLRWACHGRLPSQSQISSNNNVPLCLKVTTTGPNAVAPVASRSLCLASTAIRDDGDDYTNPSLDSNSRTPLWCYNRVRDLTDACSQYLYWSPCQKCGTAWRIFDIVDDDESYYKLPTPDYDGEEWKFPEDLSHFLSNPSASTATNDDWLGWNDRKNHWRNVTMKIEPCEDPMKECLVPDNALDTTGNLNDNIDQEMYTEFCTDSSMYRNSNSDTTYGINSTHFVLIGLAIGAGILIFICAINKCTFKGREGGDSDREGGHHHHGHHRHYGYGGGGGGFGGGGGGGGDAGGGC